MFAQSPLGKLNGRTRTTANGHSRFLFVRPSSFCPSFPFFFGHVIVVLCLFSRIYLAPRARILFPLVSPFSLLRPFDAVNSAKRRFPTKRLASTNLLPRASPFFSIHRPSPFDRQSSQPSLCDSFFLALVSRHNRGRTRGARGVMG